MLNYTKTDRVVMIATVQFLLHGLGRITVDSRLAPESLKSLTKTKRTLVKTQTRTIIHLLLYMDYIIREFQGKNVKIDGAKEVIKILDQFVSKTALFLLRTHSLPSDILTL